MSVIQIYVNKDGKYVLDVDAFKRILASSKDNKVAIYSVAGPLRTGKSFLLSFFIQYLIYRNNQNWIKEKFEKSYEYKSGPERKTTGIWMWSEPFMIEQADGTEIALYLLDTQGCFDSQTSNQENAVVFALSALLSSFMIFNIKNQVDESILQFLQYYAGFARLADTENRDEPFQKLMFLVRDWDWPHDYSYGFYDDQTSINDKNYKIDYLDSNAKQAGEVKFVHESIADTFNHISCYLMPNPGKQVSQKADFNPKTVDPEFLEHLQLFVPMVLRDGAVVPKKLGGHLLTGGQLMLFVEKWSKQFKSEFLPKSATLFEKTVEQQNDIARTMAFDNYCMKIKECLLGISDVEFQNKNDKIVNESLKLFKDYKRMGSEKFDQDCLDKLNNDLAKFYDSNFNINKVVRDQNDSKMHCDELIKNNEKVRLKMEKLEKGNLDEKNRLEVIIKQNERKYQETIKNMKENEKISFDLKELLLGDKRTYRAPTLNEGVNSFMENYAPLIAKTITTGIDAYYYYKHK